MVCQQILRRELWLYFLSRLQTSEVANDYALSLLQTPGNRLLIGGRDSQNNRSTLKNIVWVDDEHCGLISLNHGHRG